MSDLDFLLDLHLPEVGQVPLSAVPKLQEPADFDGNSFAACSHGLERMDSTEVLLGSFASESAYLNSMDAVLGKPSINGDRRSGLRGFLRAPSQVAAPTAAGTFGAPEGSSSSGVMATMPFQRPGISSFAGLHALLGLKQYEAADAGIADIVPDPSSTEMLLSTLPPYANAASPGPEDLLSSWQEHNCSNKDMHTETGETDDNRGLVDVTAHISPLLLAGMHEPHKLPNGTGLDQATAHQTFAAAASAAPASAAAVPAQGCSVGQHAGPSQSAGMAELSGFSAHGPLMTALLGGPMPSGSKKKKARAARPSAAEAAASAAAAAVRAAAQALEDGNRQPTMTRDSTTTGETDQENDDNDSHDSDGEAGSQIAEEGESFPPTDEEDEAAEDDEDDEEDDEDNGPRDPEDELQQLLRPRPLPEYVPLPYDSDDEEERYLVPYELTEEELAYNSKEAEVADARHRRLAILHMNPKSSMKREVERLALMDEDLLQKRKAKHARSILGTGAAKCIAQNPDDKTIDSALEDLIAMKAQQKGLSEAEVANIKNLLAKALDGQIQGPGMVDAAPVMPQQGWSAADAAAAAATAAAMANAPSLHGHGQHHQQQQQLPPPQMVQQQQQQQQGIQDHTVANIARIRVSIAGCLNNIMDLDTELTFDDDLVLDILNSVGNDLGLPQVGGSSSGPGDFGIQGQQQQQQQQQQQHPEIAAVGNSSNNQGACGGLMQQAVATTPHDLQAPFGASTPQLLDAQSSQPPAANPFHLTRPLQHMGPNELVPTSHHGSMIDASTTEGALQQQQHPQQQEDSDPYVLQRTRSSSFLEHARLWKRTRQASGIRRISHLRNMDSTAFTRSISLDEAEFCAMDDSETDALLASLAEDPTANAPFFPFQDEVNAFGGSGRPSLGFGVFGRYSDPIGLAPTHDIQMMDCGMGLPMPGDATDNNCQFLPLLQPKHEAPGIMAAAAAAQAPTLLAMPLQPLSQSEPSSPSAIPLPALPTHISSPAHYHHPQFSGGQPKGLPTPPAHGVCPVSLASGLPSTLLLDTLAGGSRAMSSPTTSGSPLGSAKSSPKRRAGSETGSGAARAPRCMASRMGQDADRAMAAESVNLDMTDAAEDGDGDVDGIGEADSDDEYKDDGAVLEIRPHRGGERRQINKEMLREVYHLPINEAAAHLHIGVTVLKKYCRKFQIGRWPFRKLKSMDKLIQSVKDSELENPRVASLLLAELNGFKEEVYRDPTVEIDERIKKLRQANFKLEYKQRQNGSVDGSGSRRSSNNGSPVVQRGRRGGRGRGK